ncbi:MAG: SOS response-associated peptidase [Candidatus Dormibacteria bacterium]
MCGRFGVSASADTLVERYDLEEFPAEYAPSYNLAPSLPVVTIGMEAGRHRAHLRRWGLLPYYLADAAEAIRQARPNTRAETLARGQLRVALQRGRVIVPASHFYEWQKTPSGRQPWLIHRADGDVMSLAGIHGRWINRSTGEVIESVSIVTTTPNDAVARVHDRMPVILGRDREDAWLDPAASPEAALALLCPCPDEWLEIYPVSREVNRSDSEGPGLVRRVVVP